MASVFYVCVSVESIANEIKLFDVEFLTLVFFD